ncbi:SpoIIE family protein phosphatase [Streptomyces sp. RB6PN25]|uniref:SpoIIE family protein phosphatase n=1 Tax=Streptomyces humicola TaxID=2953240 RepID=A0ABT1PPB8_9ACTN|nr:SpoIIE family protein phosphatase [Streptomyces humicola]MCQ4079515.1 SpoIIE family protein phosphatase [Streptomyces humicola]
MVGLQSRVHPHNEHPVSPAAPVATVVVDARGRVIEWSREAEQLLGYPRAEALNCPAMSLLARAVGTDPSGSVQVRHRNGGTVACGLRLRPSEAAGDGPRWTVVLTPVDRPSQEVGPPGAALTATGEADRCRHQERLSLLAEAGIRIGTRLDVMSTARELADVAVPRLADSVCVDVTDSVLCGGDPTQGPAYANPLLRRAASRSTRKASSTAYPIGEPTGLPSGAPTPHTRCLADLQPRVVSALDANTGWLAQDPVRAKRIIEEGIHSLMVVPMCARGAVLGLVSFYRSSREHGAYHEEDLALAQELAARTALCLDNALRYTRERNAALALQRGLHVRDLPAHSAADIAHSYTPSDASGAWFDVIPLPGARVAMAVGETAGRGLHAAAGMAKLRAALSTLADLDLPPDEILARLGDLVARLDAEGQAGPAAGEKVEKVAGSTCLYLVLDPVSRQCTVARAGHPAPVVVRPAGVPEILDCPAGPALGVGEEPFRKAEVELPEGSLLALCTNSLLRAGGGDPRSGLTELERVLADPYDSAAQACGAVTRALLPRQGPAAGESAALLVARTRALPHEHVVTWDLPADPAVVSTARALTGPQLALWGLDEAGFTTELVVSELVTNAIRHARGPIRLRLIRDRALTCEVSDGSSSAPHLRHARTTDEGGRGLFLVAQLTRRWGVHYEHGGKTIWAEQALP